MVTEASGTIAHYPPAAKAWRLVAIFFLASIVSTIDRGILNLVVDPVRRDLMISDVQISLLQGLSFGLFYATVGVPLGLVADRVQRRWLITAGVTVWSLATIMGGLAPNFGWMFVSRLLVGLGEATLGPCAVSMISDMFPPTRRGRPLGVYLMGQAISGGLAVMLVSFVLSEASIGLFNVFPGAHGAPPWRVAFVTAGCLGFIVIALFLTQREPVRLGVVLGASRGLAVRETASYLMADWAFFIPFFLGFALSAVAVYGMAAWNAVMLMRQFGLTPGAIGRELGLASLGAGIGGTLLAGYLVDLMAKRDVRTAKLAMLTFLPLCALPAVFATFTPNAPIAVFALSIMTFVYPMIGTSMVAAAQEMVPNNMRGVTISLFGVTNTVIGATCGPLLIAAATEHVFKDPRLVGRSITLVAVPALVAASGLFLIGWLALRRALRHGTGLARVMAIEAG